MTVDIIILAMTAATIGIFHTIIGPDHYVPFIVMSKAVGWSVRKTTAITVLSGIGHVLSSVALGFVGIALGIAVTRLEGVEATRAEIAAWCLIAFGLIYFVWGMRRAMKRMHGHGHLLGQAHARSHEHGVHDHEHGSPNLTPWILFTIFVFGPCEPLIPILMYPAATSNMMGVIVVTAVFGVCTIATMTIIVVSSLLGLSRLSMGRAERFGHAIAGATICVCGLGIQFLGL